MRAKPLVLTLCLTSCVLVGAIAFFAYSKANAQGQPCKPSGRSMGVNGITPSLQSAPAGKPCFTIADVEAYLKTHPLGRSGTVSSQPAKILHIDFITSKEASERMKGDSTGLADDALVCHVELYGPFMSGSVPYGAKPLTSDRGFEIFDARTGNLLVWGLPDAK